MANESEGLLDFWFVIKSNDRVMIWIANVF